MSSIRVASTQPAITKDVRVNGRTVRRLTREAAEAGTRLIQFPEGMMSGYAVEQINDWVDVDWAALRTELDGVSRLAGELSLWVVVGSAHPLTPPTRPHNSMYVITDEGRLLDRYDKRICSHTEITRFYTLGFDPVTFDVDGFTFGVCLCIEVNFPSCLPSTNGWGAIVFYCPHTPGTRYRHKGPRTCSDLQLLGERVGAGQCADLFASALFQPDVRRSALWNRLRVSSPQPDAQGSWTSRRLRSKWRSIARGPGGS